MINASLFYLGVLLPTTATPEAAPEAELLMILFGMKAGPCLYHNMYFYLSLTCQPCILEINFRSFEDFQSSKLMYDFLHGISNSNCIWLW